jgi:hypothetical protein
VSHHYAVRVTDDNILAEMILPPVFNCFQNVMKIDEIEIHAEYS